MCGIAGIFGFPQAAEDEVPILRAMALSIQHRGPDADGVWLDADAGIALAHRRLSIIDLSPTGEQPMTSASGRFVLTFNGEIYNFLEIRAEIEKRGGDYPFRGSSDTEVMLAAFDIWGVENALRKFTGMFAFAVWDRKERRLILARDRFGEKPLYYCRAGKRFLFASECRAFLQHPAFQARVDLQAAASYLRFGYLPAPLCIFEGVRKLLPGHMLVLDSATIAGKVEILPKTYWSFPQTVDEALANSFTGSEGDATDELDGILRRVISRQMISDVPLGCFLSGGIDSSTVAAVMQAVSERPVRTFTIGFHKREFNEAVYAKQVARHLKTDHTELYVDDREALNLAPRLSKIYDEPFADASQIPTTLVSAMARKHVTVALSGDGGDEMFGGYTRYSVISRIWKNLIRIPRPIRRVGGKLMSSLPLFPLQAALNQGQKFVPSRWRQSQPAKKFLKLASVSGSRSLDDLYAGLLALWPRPTDLLWGANGYIATRPMPSKIPPGNVFDRMMALDAEGYLPDDILVKVDRAAMSCSLETRTPFLDHELASFAWKLPGSFKFRESKGKWILRQVLYRYVPPELIERPKQGFEVPLDDWFRGALKPWAGDLLEEGRLRREGLLNARVVGKTWKEHMSGKVNWGAQLWILAMLQDWIENTFSGRRKVSPPRA